MQASLSSARSNVQLRENARLASHLNTIALYTRLIDELEPLLQDTSDLSLFWCASSARHVFSYQTADVLYWFETCSSSSFSSLCCIVRSPTLMA